MVSESTRNLWRGDGIQWSFKIDLELGGLRSLYAVPMVWVVVRASGFGVRVVVWCVQCGVGVERGGVG